MERPNCVWLAHVAIFEVWNGTIAEGLADLRNLKFIRIVRLSLVTGHENETRYPLWCVKVYEVLCMMESTGKNYERRLIY